MWGLGESEVMLLSQCAASSGSAVGLALLQERRYWTSLATSLLALVSHRWSEGPGVESHHVRLKCPSDNHYSAVELLIISVCWRLLGDCCLQDHHFLLLFLLLFKLLLGHLKHLLFEGWP